MIRSSKFISEMRPYAFAEIDRTKERLERSGADVIDFGVGDPTSPSPEMVREACKRGVDRRARSGYPSYQGSLEFREAVSKWFRARFGVSLDPAEEITATIGSKLSIFMVPLAYADPGDVILIPDPGYPPYTGGARARGAQCEYLPLKEEKQFFPDLGAVSDRVASKSKILWINYPNNPTTKIATREFLREAVDFCVDNQILLLSDEAYSEIYYEKAPESALGLDGAKEVCLVFNSLSKRSSMTGYRIGFVAGRRELLDPFRKVQTQIHSGAATFIQDAAVAALSDEDHVTLLRSEYREKRDLLVRGLEKAGSRAVYAEATFYVWAKAPDSMDSIGFSKLLLEKGHLNTVPGAALAQSAEVGREFVRFALVPSLQRTREACERIEALAP